jgi:hypothetical protein
MVYSWILKIEAISSSKTYVDFHELNSEHCDFQMLITINGLNSEHDNFQMSASGANLISL